MRDIINAKKGVGFQYAPGVEEKGAPFAVTLDGDIE